MILLQALKEKVLIEHKLHLGGPRRYDPDAGAGSEEGAAMSLLTEMSVGDWSLQVYPSGGLIAEATEGGWTNYLRFGRFARSFRPFFGVPKGMPEQLGRAREAAGEPGAIRYGT